MFMTAGRVQDLDRGDVYLLNGHSALVTRCAYFFV